MPGFIVLGLEHRYEEARTNIVVLDEESLEVVKRSAIADDPKSLVAWHGALVRCSARIGEPHTQFDPASATLVTATDKQSIACLNGEVKKADNDAVLDRTLPIVATDNYYGYAVGYETPQQYRFVAAVPEKTEAKVYSKAFAKLTAIPGHDAVIVQAGQQQQIQFARFDIGAGKETILFSFDKQNAEVATAMWRQYLFVAAGRDLFVYDLEHQLIVRYEKDLIEEGLEPFCSACADRNGIRKLQVDKDRLLALTLDGANSRVIDLPVYTKQIQPVDYFTSLMAKQAK
jgi:hypothetical protein